MIVACVLKSGGIYTDGHVARLEGQVAAHLKEPHRFVALSDVKVVCERLKLIHDWPGWWAKIELFRPGLFTGRVLYLDLDVTVVGDLTGLAHFPAPFAASLDFIPMPGIPLSKFNSSVMSWDAGVADHVYARLTPERMNMPRGDQDWLCENIDAAHFQIGDCVSYKRDVRPRGSVPHSAKVVVWHGRPKFWEVEAV